MKLAVFLILLSIFANADDATVAGPSSASVDYHYNKNVWTDFRPYIPEKNEYQAEIGGMWEKANLYWLGFTYGRHFGRCLFSNSQKCQQYLDFTGGLGSRDSITEGYILVGPRWQFVSYPRPWSPSFRIFTGVADIRDDERSRSVGLIGAGVGFTATIHPRLDLKWEVRVAQADQPFVETFAAFSLKLDKYVDYFSTQVHDLGAATVETTGSILKSTIDAPRTFIDWFNSPSDKSSGPEKTGEPK